MTGTLYLCATPIGNLGDVSRRVLETLEGVSVIAAEDTRVTKKLLTHFGIRGEVVSYHEHNAAAKGPYLLERLLQGEDVALTTDAGTPAISDPGEALVRLCIENSVPVTSLPGPCALITALTLSGLPARRFVFEGFLPGSTKEKKEVLADLAAEKRTMILYEAPHRIAKTLRVLADTLGGDRPVSLCRELTKKFEEIDRTTLGQAARAYAEKENIRGEFVLVIAGLRPEDAAAEKAAQWEDLSVAEHYERYLSQGEDQKEAMQHVARDRGISRREVYQILLAK